MVECILQCLYNRKYVSIARCRTSNSLSDVFHRTVKLLLLRRPGDKSYSGRVPPYGEIIAPAWAW